MPMTLKKMFWNRFYFDHRAHVSSGVQGEVGRFLEEGGFGGGRAVDPSAELSRYPDPSELAFRFAQTLLFPDLKLFLLEVVGL